MADRLLMLLLSEGVFSSVEKTYLSDPFSYTIETKVFGANSEKVAMFLL
jgi:hypothetical protein